MTQQESSEEASHFEQVLGRLDALLKRNQTMEEVPVKDFLPVESESGGIPVLTEIYEGESVTTSFTGADGSSADDLAGTVAKIEQTEEFPESNNPPPDAYFGKLATADKAFHQPVSESPPDYGEVAEKTLAAVMPLLQETLTRVVKEEAERVLNHIHASLTERLLGEVQNEVERELRKQLQAILHEQHNQTEI